MGAIFEITAAKLRVLPQETLTEQVCFALQQQTEQQSRAQLPGLWRVTDQLRSLAESPDAEKERRRRRRTRILSILCLFLGIYSFVPSILLEPRDPVLAVTGAAAIFVGILNMRNAHKMQDLNAMFQKPAKQLLEKLYSLPDGITLTVRFSESEVILEDVSSGKAQNVQAVPYPELDCMAETGDLYFLFCAGKGTILPKACLTSGTTEQLRMFLSIRTALFLQSESLKSR